MIRDISQAMESEIADGSSADLRQVAVTVTEETLAEAGLVAQDLLDTMMAQTLCVGLAANQIGSSLSITVILAPAVDEAPLVMYNPQLIATSGKKDRKRESCMSIFGKTGEVERRTKVQVEFSDGSLAKHVRQFDGFAARVVLHEIDHLNGILYPDHIVGALQGTNLFEGHSPKA